MKITKVQTEYRTGQPTGQSDGRLTVLLLAGLGVLSLAGSLLLAGCQSVSGYTQVSLVRVIDASNNAPAINIYVEGTLLEANVGQGNISSYGTFAPKNNAAVKVTATSNNKTLVSSSATLPAGDASSVLVTDIGAGYQVTVLADQSAAAPSGHSEFRFLNQAPSTGAVDVYFLSGTASSVLATAKPVITALPVGGTSGYVSIPSSTLYMVIAPTGTTLTTTDTTIYISQAIALVGGEVRTVLIVDPQLVTQPVQVFTANDVN
jgi:hypothetical protein